MDFSNPIKFDIKAEQNDFDSFIDAINTSGDIAQTSYNAPSDKSHFCTYKFLFNKEKCSVVYDTAAKKITLTAKSEVLEKFKALYLKREYIKLNIQQSNTSKTAKTGVALPVVLPKSANSKMPSVSNGISPNNAVKSIVKNTAIKEPNANAKGIVQTAAPNTVKPSAKPEANSVRPSIKAEPNSAKPTAKKKVQGNAKPAADNVKPSAKTAANNLKPPVKPVANNAKPPAKKKAHDSAKPAASASAVKKKPDKNSASAKSAQSSAITSTESSTDAAKTAAMQYKDGYSIKKYSVKRLQEALKAIKAMRGTSYRLESTTAQGQQAETVTYVISGVNSQKVTLRYMPKKLTVQLQGKRSNLFSEVQVLIAKDTDFKSAISPHIELTGEVTSVANMQKRLKKILPHSFDYLDEQSKIDLAIGFIDINNTETRLSDYSSLLTPPYRGLEKFISDLQRAQGIEVKMIGQGFEKDDEGKYSLKAGYRKRIDSVVFNEVMSALYTEYFSRRNFYSHSDNTDGSAPRIITDKQEVKKIFDHLIDVIDYNSKKLKEIGFSIKN